MSDINIDYTQELESFNVECGNVFPYFRILNLDGRYYVFEGAIGKDRYQYFAIKTKSKAGRECEQFIDKYERQNHRRHEYYEDGMALLESCRSGADEVLQDSEAYQKYWDMVLSGSDKKMLNFYIIPFFEPLKDWFTIQLTIKAAEQASNIKSPLTQKAQQQRWIRALHKEVADYIESSKISKGRSWSTITVEQAKEFLKFRDWLATFLTPAAGPLTLDDFSADFAEGPTFIEPVKNSATGRSDIFYSINGRRYPVQLFWIFFKDHHTRLAFAENTFSKRLIQLKRLVPQMEILRDKNYEYLVTRYQMDSSQAEEVLHHATRVIGNIQSHINDTARYLSERKNEKSDRPKLNKPRVAVIKKVLGSIQHAGRHIQQHPSLHIGKGEEAIRDVFVLRLNSMEGTNTTTSGETFNKNGKTDICVKTGDGVTIFIGECKVWKGSDKIHAALSQLVDRYIDFNTKHAALLVFVRQKGFTKIFRTLQQTIVTHRYFVKFLNNPNDNSVSLICRRPEDPDATIQIEVIAFSFYV